MTRKHRAVMGTEGPMGHFGPAWCKRVVIRLAEYVRHKARAGRMSRTSQVFDLTKNLPIRPGRPPNSRMRTYACVHRRRQAHRGGRAYVRATCFLWTF